MTRFEGRMVHIGVAAGSLHKAERLVGEAYRRTGERQRPNTLLWSRRPGDAARIVVDVELGDTEARSGIDNPHHPMLEAGVAEALEVVDAARSSLPMGHEGPHRIVLGKRLVHELADD